MRVLGTQHQHLMGVLRDLVGDRHVVDILDRARPVEDQIRQAEVWLPGRTFVTPEILDAAPKLRLVQYFGTGYDRANVPELERRRLRLATVPSVNSRSVAEFNLMLMLMLARRTQDIPGAIAKSLQGFPAGSELRGATVLLVGLGACGSEHARLCRALGMRVIAAVRSPDASAHATGAAMGDVADELVASKGDAFHAALARADYVCLHPRLTADNHALIGAAELAAMKRTAYLVNTARAELVDRAALEAALSAGTIRGCALDVFWTEPVPVDDPLLQNPRCLITHHAAGFTDQSIRGGFELVAQNIDALAAGTPLRGVIL